MDLRRLTAIVVRSLVVNAQSVSRLAVATLWKIMAHLNSNLELQNLM